MSNFLSQLKSFFKKVSNFFKINPHRHWVFLLYVFFSMTALLILFSFYLLYQIKTDQVFQVKIEQDEKSNLIKEDLLNKTIKLDEEKTNLIKEIENNHDFYKDPSL